MRRKLMLGMLSMTCFLAVMLSELQVKAGTNILYQEDYIALHKANINRFIDNSCNEINVKLLQDLHGNVFQVVETGDKGYYIFDEVSGRYLEQAPESPSPYLGLDENLYYFGPMNYYQEIGGVFKHTILTEEISTEIADSIQEDFSNKIGVVREDTDLEGLTAFTQKNITKKMLEKTYNETQANYKNIYVPNYTYIKNAIYPLNTDGTCGYTAACIVLNYWNKSGYYMIDNKFLDKNGDLKIERESEDIFTLQDQLLEYGKTNNSTGMKISNVVNKYCDEYGIDATANYHLLANSVYEEMEAGHPVIIFGNFDNVSSPEQERINHAMTFYGEHIVGDSSTVTYMIVHYGWPGYEEIIVTSGLLGSSTVIVPN